MPKRVPHLDCCRDCVATGDQYSDGCCCCWVHERHGGSFTDPVVRVTDNLNGRS